ncbi:MAG: hypothetical protein BGN82_01565 [Alphaproteobacteria bacterium 65-7]|nr:MAG: hypothetical protein BGN82_01565 [Alphaproteobacteria bacterium 65-7]
MNAAPTGTDPGENPAGYFVLLPPQQSEMAKLDLRRVFQRLLDNWKLILACALVFTVLAGIHAYVIAQPLYRARVVVAVRNEGGIGGSVGGGQVGGLASLVGVKLGGGGSARFEFIAKLRSRQLIEMLIKQDNLLPILFAKKYDADAHQWRNKAPTMDDGVAAFTKTLSISEDLDSGLLTVMVNWTDRFLAARWAQGIVDLANRNIRASAYSEAQRNLAYLTGQAKEVQVDSLRQSIVHLMEANLNQSMLANSQPDYAFKTIDPATVPDADKSVWPVRKVELVAGFVIGAFLASLYVLWRDRKI